MSRTIHTLTEENKNEFFSQKEIEVRSVFTIPEDQSKDEVHALALAAGMIVVGLYETNCG